MPIHFAVAARLVLPRLPSVQGERETYYKAKETYYKAK